MSPPIYLVQELLCLFFLRQLRLLTVLLIAVRFDILQSQGFLFLIRPLIIFHLYLRVRIWRRETLHIAARKRVLQRDVELLLSFDRLVQLLKKLFPPLFLRDLHAIPTTCIILITKDARVQIVPNLSQQAFNRGEPAAKRARLNLKLQLWTGQSTGLTLQDVAVQKIGRAHV